MTRGCVPFVRNCPLQILDLLLKKVLRMDVTDQNQSERSEDQASRSSGVERKILVLEILVFLMVVVLLGGFLAFQMLLTQSEQTYAADKAETLKKISLAENVSYRLDRKQEALSSAIDNLSTKINRPVPTNVGAGLANSEDILETLQYLYDESDPDVKRDSARPVAFSYYWGQPWRELQDQLRSKLSRTPMAGPLIDGAGGVDTMKVGGRSRDSRIDGMYAVHFEVYDYKNDMSNVISVLAPALADIDSNELTIVTDNDLDEVVLDGCLFWDKDKIDNDKFDVWIVSDINNLQRIVKITKGAKQRVASECNNRYLAPYSKKYAAYVVGRIKPSSDVQPSPLSTRANDLSREGGVGIQFSKSGFIGAGVEVIDAVPGKPAYKSGIRAGDTIVKINEQAVSDITIDVFAQKLRGAAGTTVSVTYIPKGERPEKSRSASMIREPLDSGTPSPSAQWGRTQPDPSIATLIPGSGRGPNGVGLNREGDPGLAWGNVTPDNKWFLVTPETQARGKDRHIYTIKNDGGNDVLVPDILFKDMAGRDAPGWELMPGSSCERKVLKPGQSCQFTVRAVPDSDGQLSVYMTFNRSFGAYNKDKDSLWLEGYARGISGKLPPHVIGNGDNCPQNGTSAEIALSGKGMFGISGGYFGRSRRVTNEVFHMWTLSCPAWTVGSSGNLYCVNDKLIIPTLTLRTYKSEGTNGPWVKIREDFQSVNANISCRDGQIERINWSQ